MFNMTGSTLAFKAAPPAGDYAVNVTASGNSVFEDGNNWRVLGVKAAGSNQPPVADAGADQDVNEGATVALDGTGSSDPDSDPLTYSWESDGTPQITLDGRAPTFTAPPVGASGGTVTFTLTVSDGNGGTDTDTVVITVNDVAGPNQPPAADAGADQGVNEGATVALDGSGSSDPDSDPLTYSWESDGTPQITLDGRAPTFTAPQVGAPGGTVTFTLTVSDGNGGTDTDTVVITVNDVAGPNQPPTADAGADQGVNEGATVALDGSGSSDPDSDPLTYSWESDGAPQITLDGRAPTFTAPQVGAPGGTVTFTLTVSDGNGGTDTDTVVITVNDVAGPNQPPVITGITGTTTINELERLDLTASASDADADDSLTFTLEGTPPSGASITNNGEFTWTPTELQDGSHTITVRVEDGNGGSDSEAVTVTVNEVNAAPVLASIGSKSVDELETLAFPVTATDADVIGGVDDSLVFSLTGTVPTGATINPDSGEFTWTPTELQDGSYTITVSVSDGTETASQDVQVEVSEVNRPPTLTVADSHAVNELSELAFEATVADADLVDNAANTLEFSLTERSRPAPR